MATTWITTERTSMTIGGEDFSAEFEGKPAGLKGGYSIINAILTLERDELLKTWADGKAIPLVHEKRVVAHRGGATIEETRKDEATVRMVRCWKFPEAGTFSIIFQVVDQADDKE